MRRPSVVGEDDAAVHIVPVVYVSLYRFRLLVGERRQKSVFAFDADKVSCNERVIFSVDKVDVRERVDAFHVFKRFDFGRNAVDDRDVFRRDDRSAVRFERNADDDGTAEHIFRVDETRVGCVLVREKLSDRIVELNVFELDTEYARYDEAYDDDDPRMLKKSLHGVSLYFVYVFFGLSS